MNDTAPSESKLGESSFWGSCYGGRHRPAARVLQTQDSRLKTQYRIRYESGLCGPRREVHLLGHVLESVTSVYGEGV